MFKAGDKVRLKAKHTNELPRFVGEMCTVLATEQSSKDNKSLRIQVKCPGVDDESWVDGNHFEVTDE